MEPTFGSLFAGIGGIDLGFERAGWRCAWQVEINDFCRRVLAKHWPDVRRHDDVRTFPATTPDDWRVDCIVGGFPCKQTSRAAAIQGRRRGLQGPDSGLWRDMLRVVRALGPALVLVENPASEWLETVKADLEGAGYHVARSIRTAWEFGAPHLRRRVFTIAYRDGAGLAVAGACGSPAADIEAGRTPYRNAWLSSLCRVMRVADGVPGGVDRRERIAACGNAVVPQVAEWIGRRLRIVMEAA